MKRIVVIGGGTGSFTVLSGLRDYPFEITSIVSTADDGGSTGQLRDELGVLPPGDIRQALVALAADYTTMRELFTYRFEEGTLKGHTFGNLFLSSLEKVTGSFDQAVLEAGKILAVRGKVLPVTTDQVHLRARTISGKLVKGEHKIEEYIWSDQGDLDKVWLEPNAQVHPLAEQAILKANMIIIAPGSLFTSLIPNLLVGGVWEAIQKSKASVVYLANLMTEKGQTGSYFVQDFVKILEDYLGQGRINYVIYNTKEPNEELLNRYKKEMERGLVKLDSKRIKNLSYNLIGTPLLADKKSISKTAGTLKKSDALAKTRTLIRHDPKKIAEVIQALISFKDTKKYFKLIK